MVHAVIGVLKKEKDAEERRKVLMNHFRKMDHNRLVSFINCWLTNKEIKHLCRSEGLKIK